MDLQEGRQPPDLDEALKFAQLCVKHNGNHRAIANDSHYEKGTVARKIHYVRNTLGLLSPTTRGVKRPELTPLANDLLAGLPVSAAIANQHARTSGHPLGEWGYIRVNGDADQHADILVSLPKASAADEA
ncbi:MAG: hypothetical protein JO321_05410 [Solirubrobacterales bacterium]|nr:hypothetical protein [Solirubrobacterales bacterium]MBV9534834.1 hypothetical protein [Solirubrobacterales bacterium]